MEELLGLPPEKVLLKWMNFHLKKAGYEKQVTNFSSDVKVRECSLVDEQLAAWLRDKNNYSWFDYLMCTEFPAEILQVLDNGE